MKKNAFFRTAVLLTLCLAMVFTSGCSKQEKKIPLEERKIKQISEFSTIKCKTHAYLEASQDETSWFIKIFNPDQAYHYIAEYDGEFSVGIDYQGLSFDEESNDVVVTISKPRIIDLNINNDTLADYPVLVFDEDRVYREQRKLPINEYSRMLAEAQKELKEYVEQNRLNFDTAEENAKQLITNYINQIAKLNNKEYHVTFKYQEEEGK
jgi:hypothetical protein